MAIAALVAPEGDLGLDLQRVMNEQFVAKFPSLREVFLPCMTFLFCFKLGAEKYKSQ